MWKATGAAVTLAVLLALLQVADVVTFGTLVWVVVGGAIVSGIVADMVRSRAVR